MASERHPGRNQLTLASWVLEGRCTLLLFSNSWAGSQPTSLQEDSHFTPVWTRLIRTNTEKGCISYSVSGQHTYPGRNVRCMLTWKASTLLRNQAQLLADWDTLSSSAHISSPSVASHLFYSIHILPSPSKSLRPSSTTRYTTTPFFNMPFPRSPITHGSPHFLSQNYTTTPQLQPYANLPAAHHLTPPGHFPLLGVTVGATFYLLKCWAKFFRVT